MATSQNSTPVQADLRKLQKRHLIKSIEETLMKFKFEHLIGDTLANLFELEPVEIVHKINELKLKRSKQNVVDLLSNRCKAFDVEELKNALYLLQLYRTAFFSKLKQWIPVNLLEPYDNFKSHAAPQIIKRNILQAFRIKGLNAIIKVLSHDDMIWVMIIVKKLTRKNGVKLQTPVFVCYEVGTPYIFVTPTVPQLVMLCILKAMEYKNYKYQDLNGKDVKSLLNILKHKAMRKGNTAVIPYEPAEAEVGLRNIDFSKKKARSLYADQVFQTNDPVYLDTFTVEAESVWHESNLVPGMNGEPFVTTMQLKSKDLIGMIKHMVTKDMVATPVPEYMQIILHSGKNRLKLRAAKRHNNTL